VQSVPPPTSPILIMEDGFLIAASFRGLRDTLPVQKG